MLSKGRTTFLLISFLVVLSITGSRWVAAANRQGADDPADDSPYKYLAVFMEVFGLVGKAYVDEPDPSKLLAGAFEGAADALDPFSLYVPAEAVDTFLVSRSVGSERTGLLLLKERGVAFVVAVDEGSPAALAGIERGDILSEIGGRRTRQTPLYEIHAMLAGREGSELEVERLRQGKKKSITMTLGSYPPPAVELTAMRGLPVLRIPAFHDTTATDVASALAAIDAQSLDGLETTDRLLVDLRGVAGGEEAAAFAVAELFAAGDLGTLDRRGETLTAFTGRAAPRWTGERLVLLTDRGTQGPAEVLTAVLQQRVDAVLVGEPTFGHSGELDLIELSDGSRLQVTRAFFTGPDGVPLDDSIDPDHRVRAFRAGPTLGDDAPEAPELPEGVDPSTAPDPAVADPETSSEAAEAPRAPIPPSEDSPADEADEVDAVLERGLDILLETPQDEPAALAA